MKFFISTITIISLVFFIVLTILNLDYSYLRSITLGWSISFVYIITGFLLFSIAIKQKNKTFGKMVTISVFGRLFFAVVGIILVVKLFEIHNTVFVIALISFYFIFQIMELVGLNKIYIKGA